MNIANLNLFDQVSAGRHTPLAEGRTKNTPFLQTSDIFPAGSLTTTDAHGLMTSGLASPRQSSGIQFSLSGLRKMADELIKQVQKNTPLVSNNLPSEDEAVSLERLVLEKMFGIKTQNVSLSATATFNNSSALSNHAELDVQAVSIDLSIEVENVQQWQGELSFENLSIQLHLEQVSVSATEWLGDDKAEPRLLNSRIADTGRYLIGFQSSISLEIYDKHTKLSTTIWGDPHVDLSDVEGNMNGEFSDLKKSDMFTTVALLDGTKVVIKAPDTGVIEKVDIYKGNNHIQGIGSPTQESLQDLAIESAKNRDFDALIALFAGGFFIGKDSDTSQLQSLMQQSDIVMAGGDGNDWFGKDGRLVWGNKK